MKNCDFPLVENPEHPGSLIQNREDQEIDRWIEQREREAWSRLIAFQLIYGSLLWLFVFGGS